MKILFVCSGNAFRSPVAEALLKKLNTDVDVDSAGSNLIVPDAISGSAGIFLAKESARHLLKRFPEGLNRKQLDKYDLIIAMKESHQNVILEKCPECEKRIIIWNIDDPYFLPHKQTEIFEQIKQKVTELAASLRKA